MAPSLINAFAPPHLRGRYNAVGGLVWSVSGALGPIIAGVMIGSGWGIAWALLLAVGALRGRAGPAPRCAALITAEEDGREAAAAVSVAGMRG